MAFEDVVTDKENMGSLKFHYGTYTNGVSDVGGDIDTELNTCLSLKLQANGSAVIASQNVVNETFPVAGNAVTIVTTANEDGYWQAIGY